MIPEVIQTGTEILLQLVVGIMRAVVDLIAAGYLIIDTLLETFVAKTTPIFNAGADILEKVIEGFVDAISSVASAVRQVVEKICNGFKNTDWISVGINIIDGIVEGVSGAASRLANAAANAARNALEAVKNWLGIASPSKVFRDEVGKYMALGIGVGFEDNIPIHALQSDMSSLLDNLEGYNMGALSLDAMRSGNSAGYSTGPLENSRQLMKQIILEAINESNLDRDMARSVSAAMEGVGIYCDRRQIGRLKLG